MICSLAGNLAGESCRGQWQKLAIAGAMLKNRSILILDEPASALTSSSEYEILSRFARMMEENTK